MANIEKINKSLQDIEAIIKATDGVLRNPSLSLEEELSKHSSAGKHLAPILGTAGVAGIVAATGASTLSTGIATLIGATTATATGLTVSGPVGWAIGGAIVLLGGGAIYKKYKAAKRVQQEKERLKNELIRKQQALINKLKRENELNNNEIRNLKEALSVLEGLLKEMNKKAA